MQTPQDDAVAVVSHARRKVIFVMVIAIIVAYFLSYLSVRSSHKLVHRANSSGQNQIVPGDFNPGIFLLAGDVDAAAETHHRGESFLVYFYAPLRWAEVLYHNCFYEYAENQH